MKSVLRISLLMAIVSLPFTILFSEERAQASSSLQRFSDVHLRENVPSVTQFTFLAPPTNSKAPPAGLSFPSQAEMQSQIINYYTHMCSACQKNPLRRFLGVSQPSLTGSDASAPTIEVCAMYEVYPLGKQPTENFSHAYYFRYDNHVWHLLGVESVFHGCHPASWMKTE